MDNRDWFCLAARLFGLWLLISAVEGVASNVYFLVFATGLSPGLLYSTVIWLVVRTTFALVVVSFAPAIATRLYPHSASADPVTSEASSTDRVETRKLLKIGMQLLGFYALFLSVRFGGGALVGHFFGVDWITPGLMERAVYEQCLVNFGINFVFGITLLIWNEDLVHAIEKFRYVPGRDV